MSEWSCLILNEPVKLGYWCKFSSRFHISFFFNQEMLKCSKNSEDTAELEEALATVLDIIKSVNDSMHQIAITGYEVLFALVPTLVLTHPMFLLSLITLRLWLVHFAGACATFSKTDTHWHVVVTEIMCHHSSHVEVGV